MKEKQYMVRSHLTVPKSVPKIEGIDSYIMDFAAENDAIPLKENWGERWCTLVNTYDNVMDEVLNFEVRPDDVFVNTFMKCGTTWMQETAWLLLNNLDFEKAKSINISERSPNVDGSGGVPREPSTMEQCRHLSSPRLIKSHLPPNLLPRQIWEKKAKIIYVARNVKDCVSSAYPFLKNMGYILNSFEDFVDDFVNNEIVFMPYLERMVDMWKMRNEPNVFFVTYEEMKRDLPGVLQRLCKFLGRPELTPDELQKTVNHLTFDKMKDNKQAHIHDYCKNITMTQANKDFKFMRRGIIGSYKDEMPIELQKILDDYTNKVLSKHNLKEEDIFGKL